MNFRQIFNSVTGRIKKSRQLRDGQQLAENPSDINYGNLKPDMLGQGISRLFYPLEAMDKAHSEEYEIALKVIGDFNAIRNYGERLAFWYAHPQVFGYSCIIIFDTQEKIYYPYYGRPQCALSVDYGEQEGRYLVIRLFPDDVEQFYAFSAWCVDKFSIGPRIVVCKEEVHWYEIKTHEFAGDYIIERLAKFEELRHRVVKPSESDVSDLYTDEVAMRYFFSHGREAATIGRDNFWNVLERLSVLRNVLVCPLSTYADIIYEYTFGFEITKRVSFLRKQKERWDKGENVQIPADWLEMEREKGNPSEQTQSDTETSPNEVCRFEDLFFNSAEAARAIKILYKVTTAEKLSVIDTNNLWLGKSRDGSRSVLLAWVEVLRVQGWFRIQVSNKIMSKLLNDYFKGLKLKVDDGSLWRKQKGSEKINGYYADFLQHTKNRKIL